MIEHLWDGEMDCGWEDLAKKVVDTSTAFGKQMLETVACSFNSDTQELINDETMDRFLNLARLVSENLENGFFYETEDIENRNDNAYKLNLWIILGSLTECALQMFLAFNIDDYRNSKWQQWEDVSAKEIKDPIINVINSLVSDNTITSAQGKTLKKAIKDKITEHTVEHPVQKVMLDEIIQFYIALGLMDEDEIIYLKSIQSNRNGIHSFEGRKIGTWDDLQYCVRFWCYLLEWIQYHLPDIPDIHA